MTISIEQAQDIYGDLSEEDVKELETRVHEDVPQMAVSYTHLTLPTILLV